MRVLMLSKALVVGAYQRKLELLAETGSVDLTCVVPPSWAGQRLDRAYLNGYRLVVRPIRFDGNFHLFHFTGLGEVFRTLRPDIVHIDEEPYNLATWLALRHALAVGARPVFFTWQNLTRRYPPPFRWFEQDVYRRAAHAIAGNDEAVGVLRTKGYRGPVAVVPQFGVDPDAFTPRLDAVRSVQDGQYIIGYAGRLIEAKGLRVLFDALVSLGGNWRLRLLGDGPLRAELVARADQLGLGERVSFEHAIRSTAMPEWLSALDTLVLPSLTRANWKEQFGRVLIEAMACEVPVVGSASGEIPRVVGDAGLIVPENEPDALGTALERLRRDAALRGELGRQGRARVLHQFTHRRVAELTVDVYRRMMECVP